MINLEIAVQNLCIVALSLRDSCSGPTNHNPDAPARQPFGTTGDYSGPVQWSRAVATTLCRKIDAVDRYPTVAGGPIGVDVQW